ncbi:unnamed protein product [Rotaria sp. Silwood2]|nr:unnamed protein product [Rotaria sp. Silwood2]CAF2595851.1 unnamed protein product [Rotaria sp. Silwood2]CAF2858223.1 unnamed protein product [Rotaria sp. Silwood2]CAF3003169.1 unnamed protein product [Rotaria sp. Silwood2]CAF3869736.1 unnamed protein product [Rotaria sp. Silwood2]
MHWNIGVISIFLCTIIIVFGRRDLFEKKCKRKCDTAGGSLECWKETTDGFAYGLSTAMIDFCQETWYNISREILAEQIEKYELDEEVQQLTKENIEQIAMSLLDNCFYASSSITSLEPSCPSCSEAQTKLMKQWGIASIILISIGLLLVFIVLILFAFYIYYTRRSYISIK